MGFSCSEACGIFLDQGLNLCLLSHQGNPWTFLSWVTIQPSTACLARYLPVSETCWLCLPLPSYTHTYTQQTTSATEQDFVFFRTTTPCWEQSGCSIHLCWWEDGWTGEPKKGMVPKHHSWQPSPATFQSGNAFGGLLIGLQGLRGATKIYWSLLFQSL